jgi:pimeloyl-ACP methyl ester carboxylesterase
MSWRAWRPVLGELERHHDVYVPTLAGHRGGIPLGDGVEASVSALVDALCDDLDEAGLPTAHVAGNSLGGWVALELARRGRARSVVALSPAGGWARPFDLARLVRLFRVGLALGGTATARRAVHRPTLRHFLLRSAMQHGERVPEVDIDEMLAGAAAHGPLGALTGVTCPIRIAWAEHDHIVPWRHYGRPFLETVPQGEFVRLPGCGHLPMWDDPELVSRVILQVSSSVSDADRVRSG